VAVLSHARRQGKGGAPLLVDFPNKRVLEFSFDIIDLARLDARVFVKCRNPAALALAARMKFEAKERIKGLSKNNVCTLLRPPGPLAEGKRLMTPTRG
jgi:hypothetical protein